MIKERNQLLVSRNVFKKGNPIIYLTFYWRLRFRELMNEQQMMKKMVKSINNAPRALTTETSSAPPDVFFEISINNQRIGEIKFKVR